MCALAAACMGDVMHTLAEFGEGAAFQDMDKSYERIEVPRLWDRPKSIGSKEDRWLGPIDQLYTGSRLLPLRETTSRRTLWTRRLPAGGSGGGRGEREVDVPKDGTQRQHGLGDSKVAKC